MQHRVAEREMNDLRDKLVNANRSITSATGNISNQEALICQLRGKFCLVSLEIRLIFMFFFILLHRRFEESRGKGTTFANGTKTFVGIFSDSLEYTE